LNCSPRLLARITSENRGLSRGRLHGVFRCAIEDEVVDDVADDDVAAHELADGIAKVLVISAEPFHPREHENVASTKAISPSPRVGRLPNSALGQRPA
jgi:hypothetical protein